MLRTGTLLFSLFVASLLIAISLDAARLYNFENYGLGAFIDSGYPEGFDFRKIQNTPLIFDLLHLAAIFVLFLVCFQIREKLRLGWFSVFGCLVASVVGLLFGEYLVGFGSPGLGDIFDVTVTFIAAGFAYFVVRSKFMKNENQ